MSASDGTGGRIHIEPAHRVVYETVRARIFADPAEREAVDVRSDDFDGVTYYVSVLPEQKNVLRVSLFAPAFAELKEAVGEKFFADMYTAVGAVVEAPQQGYSLTVAVDLDTLPADAEAKEKLADRLSTMKRDVAGAPLWVAFKALLGGVKPPRSYYAIPNRPNEMMYVVPSDDLVVVVYAISFANHIEQAIARAFLQEIVISRRQSRDLMTAPSVTYSATDPPHELKQIAGVPMPKKDDTFVGFVSLAVSKRILESGRLEKVVTLTEGYRSFLLYHVQATKSHLHTRIRRRASSWLQVLNRAMPEKLNIEKKTIKGRTFNRA